MLANALENHDAAVVKSLFAQGEGWLAPWTHEEYIISPTAAVKFKTRIHGRLGQIFLVPHSDLYIFPGFPDCEADRLCLK